MKKIIIASALFIGLLSCNNETGGEPSLNDSISLENAPSAFDTTQHPTGITTGSVISTDTASMNVEKMRQGAQDSASLR